MVVRIHNVGKWSVLQPGNVLQLNGTGARQVRLEVNCAAPTAFHVRDGNGVLTFLAVVLGLEALEFTVEGEAEVIATGEDDVWFFTNVGDEIATQPDVEQVSFTKLRSRQTSNPSQHQQLMMLKMTQNVERRLQHMEAEIAARDAAIAAMEAQRETGRGSGSADGAAGDTGGAAAGTAEQSGTGAGDGGGTA